MPGGNGQLLTLGLGLLATAVAATYVTRLAKVIPLPLLINSLLLEQRLELWLIRVLLITIQFASGMRRVGVFFFYLPRSLALKWIWKMWLSLGHLVCIILFSLLFDAGCC